MKVTMYELLGMVKDGEVPKKIKYDDRIFNYLDGVDYQDNNGNDLFGETVYISEKDLNDEVEIIEEEKKVPEKFDNYKINSELHTPIKCEQLRQYFEMLCESYNQLIDYLKSKGE